MSVQSIQCLEAQVTNLSMPIETIKIPKISKSVRAIFEECAPDFTDVSVQPHKKFRLAVPNLHLKAFEYRQQAIDCKRESIELRNKTVLHAAGAFAAGSLSAMAVGTLYRAVFGSLGILGTGLSLAAGAAPFIYFVPKKFYTSNWHYIDEFKSLSTEIKNYKAFFAQDNCRLIEQAIRAKLQQMNDKEVMKPKYEKALVQLKQNRGYIC